MCWFGDRNDKRVAKEDIRCKKVFYRTPGYFKVKRYVSPVFKAPYKQGDTAISKIGIHLGTGYWMIDQGIHCYNMKKVEVERSMSESGERLIAKRPLSTKVYGANYQCVHYGNDIGMQVVLVECIIPKGAIYYENKSGEIVTEKLIIGEEITVK